MRRPAMRTPRRGQGNSRRPTPLPSPPVRGGPKGPPVRAVPKTPPKPRPTGKGLGGSTKGGPGPMTIARGGKSDVGTPRTQRPTRSGPYGGRVPKRVKETLSPIKKTPPNTGTSSKTAAAPPTGSRAAAMRRRKRSGGLAGALRRAATAKASRPPAPPAGLGTGPTRNRPVGGRGVKPTTRPKPRPAIDPTRPPRNRPVTRPRPTTRPRPSPTPTRRTPRSRNRSMGR